MTCNFISNPCKPLGYPSLSPIAQLKLISTFIEDKNTRMFLRLLPKQYSILDAEITYNNAELQGLLTINDKSRDFKIKYSYTDGRKTFVFTIELTTK